jgi:hypothetical protein
MVDPVQYELDTFNSWHNLSSYGALRTPTLEAVQVFAPPYWDDVGEQPLLSDPLARVGGDGHAHPHRRAS